MYSKEYYSIHEYKYYMMITYSLLDITYSLLYYIFIIIYTRERINIQQVLIRMKNILYKFDCRSLSVNSNEKKRKE